jgi:hypothetical protein
MTDPIKPPFKCQECAGRGWIDVSFQEFYNEVHSFMNRYGSFLKGQKDIWDNEMRHYRDVPEGMEDVDAGKHDLNFFYKKKPSGPGGAESR